MVKQTRENTLFLILKKEWYDKILSGEKKEEYRDFTDYYISRLCELDKQGNIVNMKDYKFVRFQLGYSKQNQMLVEVKDLILEFDSYDEDTGKFENPEFVIYLGEILEVIK